MLIQLGFENLLVLFVDVRYLFRSDTLFCLSRDLPCINLACKTKPKSSVVIFDEVASHLQNFVVVHLLDKVAYFDALLHAVFVVFTLCYKMNFFPAASKIVLNLTCLYSINVLGIKHNLNRLAGPLLRSDTCLQHPHVCFVAVFLKPGFFLYV